MKNSIDNIHMQIVEGLAEAINGEGFDVNMMEDISLEEDGAIRVLLADLPQDSLSELVAEVHDRISSWKVYPFGSIDYDGKRTMKFYLKPDDEIVRLYRSRM